MQCPVCSDVSLVMSERQGVEIDYCPKCRGVWLDRGELDKIIERSGELLSNDALPSADYGRAAPARDPRSEDYRREEYRRDDSRREDYRERDKDYYKHKKRKSFWSEIFDFD